MSDKNLGRRQVQRRILARRCAHCTRSPSKNVIVSRMYSSATRRSICAFPCDVCSGGSSLMIPRGGKASSTAAAACRASSLAGQFPCSTQMLVALLAAMYCVMQKCSPLQRCPCKTFVSCVSEILQPVRDIKHYHERDSSDDTGTRWRKFRTSPLRLIGCCLLGAALGLAVQAGHAVAQ